MQLLGGVTAILLLVLANSQSETTNDKPDHCPEQGEKKFKLHSDKLNWHQALIYCMANNMRLATINSQEEHNLVVGQIKELNVNITGGWWIGGADLGRKGDFFWYSTARRFNYTNFYDGQPDNRIYENGESEHCLELKPNYDYVWNDFVCDYYQFYVCEYYSTA